jgi:hypothetical protein
MKDMLNKGDVAGMYDLMQMHATEGVAEDPEGEASMRGRQHLTKMPLRPEPVPRQNDKLLGGCSAASARTRQGRRKPSTIQSISDELPIDDHGAVHVAGWKRRQGRSLHPPAYDRCWAVVPRRDAQRLEAVWLLPSQASPAPAKWWVTPVLFVDAATFMRANNGRLARVYSSTPTPLACSQAQGFHPDQLENITSVVRTMPPMCWSMS